MAFPKPTLEMPVIGLRKKTKTICALLALLLLCTGTGHTENPQQVRVAVAANFATCLKDLAPTFLELTGFEVVPIVGSTGRHFAQISAGAPFDVFLSADRHHAQLLMDNGRAEAAPTFIYAQGQLVLWLSEPTDLDLQDILSDPELRPVAMANPRLAPYGEAARQTLEHLKFPADLNGRLIMGTNVGQTWQFAATGNAKAAFVSLSQVKNFPENQIIIVPINLYQPIEQQAVLLTHAASLKPAREFLHFLASEQAQQMIRAHGYLTGKQVP